jgi:lipopolysaccharide transport system ATP-binding protein
MSDNIITVQNLSKRYFVGHREHQQHSTFRDMLTREARNFARKAVDLAHGREIVQGDQVEEFWHAASGNFSRKVCPFIALFLSNSVHHFSALQMCT